MTLATHFLLKRVTEMTCSYHRGYISNLEILQSSLHKRWILLFSFENPSFGNRSRTLFSIKKNQVNSAAEPQVITCTGSRGQRELILIFYFFIFCNKKREFLKSSDSRVPCPRWYQTPVKKQ